MPEIRILIWIFIECFGKFKSGFRIFGWLGFEFVWMEDYQIFIIFFWVEESKERRLAKAEKRKIINSEDYARIISE